MPRKRQERAWGRLTYGTWHPPNPTPPCASELELGFLLLRAKGILKDPYLATTEFWMQNGP